MLAFYPVNLFKFCKSRKFLSYKPVPVSIFKLGYTIICAIGHLQSPVKRTSTRLNLENNINESLI